MASNAIHDRITESIIKALERGTVPWAKPWHTDGSAHKNGASGHTYQGINTLLLACEGRSTPYWYTLNQVHAKGGRVTDQEFPNGAVVTFFKKVSRAKPKADQDPSYALLRYYRVWNLDQTEDLEGPPSAEIQPLEFEPVERAEHIIARYHNGPHIEESPTYGPAYLPRADIVRMPTKEQFQSIDLWYHTLFHELGHSTGASTRLARAGIINFDQFGSEQYGKEELIADMTAAFLCAEAGLTPNVEHSASYVASWIRSIKADHSLVYWAASAATKATKWMVAGAGAVEKAA